MPKRKLLIAKSATPAKKPRTNTDEPLDITSHFGEGEAGEGRRDFAVVVVLDTELRGIQEAVQVVGGSWEFSESFSRGCDYQCSFYEVTLGDLRGLICRTPSQGQNAMPSAIKAIMTTMKRESDVPLRLLCLIGCSAGVSHKLRVGDVVIAREVNNYDHHQALVDREKSKGVVQFDGETQSPDRAIFNECAAFSSAHPKEMAKWERTCKQVRARKLSGGGGEEEEEEEEEVKLELGRVVSGTSVVKSETSMKSIQDFAGRSTLALDTESAFFLTCSEAECTPRRRSSITAKKNKTTSTTTTRNNSNREPGDEGERIPTMIIRGISDFADERKSKFDGMKWLEEDHIPPPPSSSSSSSTSSTSTSKKTPKSKSQAKSYAKGNQTLATFNAALLLFTMLQTTNCFGGEAERQRSRRRAVENEAMMRKVERFKGILNEEKKLRAEKRLLALEFETSLEQFKREIRVRLRGRDGVSLVCEYLASKPQSSYQKLRQAVEEIVTDAKLRRMVIEKYDLLLKSKISNPTWKFKVVGGGGLDLDFDEGDEEEEEEQDDDDGVGA